MSMTKKSRSRSVAESDRKKLRQVSKLVELSDVKLCEVSLRSEGDCSSVEGGFNRLVVQHGSSPQLDLENNVLTVMVPFSVEMSGDEDEEGNESLRIYICGSYELVYELDFKKVSDQDAIDVFADVNAPFNAWPYIRELVQSLTSRMGMCQLTVPVYRPDAPQKIRYSKKTKRGPA